VKLFRI